MNLSLSWLADFIEPGLPVPELEKLLTRTGLKVEKVFTSGVAIDRVVVGQILDSQPHPNADRLSVCQVEEGSGHPRQIVCGAKNYKVGDKVPVALPGAVLPGDFKIKAGKLRGVASDGMMCSARELELPGDDAGLLILPADTPVGQPLGDLFPPRTVLELEITPNRPDWLSHLGVAREIAAFQGRALDWRRPESKVRRTENKARAEVFPGTACRFYAVRRIEGVRVGPSPAWLRERLESIGLRPINNVVDVTNYVLHELGQPLHAFDAAKVQDGLRIRTATEGEHFLALDARDYELQSSDTVIADAKGVLALGGVMGGAGSGVTEATTTVLLESAYFESAGIRATSRRSGLGSDSSYRFERGVDPEMVIAASERATELILELAGGAAEELLVVAGDWAGQPGAMEVGGRIAPVSDVLVLRHDRCRALLGLAMEDATILNVLERVGLQRVDGTEEAQGRSSWRTPSYRIDLLREVDLIEEVIRVVGIDEVPGRVSGLVHPELPSDWAWDFAAGLRQDLIRLGFFETRLSTLVSREQLLDLEECAVRLKNPLGEEQSWLRPSLLPGLLACARRNFHLGASAVRLFELGAVFSLAGEGLPPTQRLSLGLVACGENSPSTWQKLPVRTDGLFDVLGWISSLVGGQWKVEPSEKSGWAKVGRLCFEGQPVGWIGILQPALARTCDAPGDIILAEVELAPLLDFSRRPAVGARPLAKFPAVHRDLALVVDRNLPYERISRVLQEVKEPLLISHTPIDLFVDPSGEKLSADKKSLAVSLTFQSPERTLTSEEIEQALDRIKALSRDQLGADFRE